MPTLISRGRGRRTINEINMVPFIDVMLVLLIIFMVTAPLIKPSMIDLPSVGKAAKQPDAVIQIIIRKDENLELKLLPAGKESAQSAISTVADQVKKLQARQANTAVVISADKSVKYETVVQVMDKLKRAGIERVGLSVQLAP
ncbi:MAG: biopolymer transporter ExbD [Brachymonas sp.]